MAERPAAAPFALEPAGAFLAREPDGVPRISQAHRQAERGVGGSVHIASGDPDSRDPAGVPPRRENVMALRRAVVERVGVADSGLACRVGSDDAGIGRGRERCVLAVVRTRPPHEAREPDASIIPEHPLDQDAAVQTERRPSNAIDLSRSVPNGNP